MIDEKHNKLNEDLDDEDLDDEDFDEGELDIRPGDFYALFEGDKNLYAQAANILYDWYEAEGAFEDFSSKEEFLDFVRRDIYGMLDAADWKEDVITVEKAMGIYDPEQWEDDEELEESFKSKDKYSVLREALDRLDREDDKARRVKTKARIKSLRSRLKA